MEHVWQRTRNWYSCINSYFTSFLCSGHEDEGGEESEDEEEEREGGAPVHEEEEGEEDEDEGEGEGEDMDEEAFDEPHQLLDEVRNCRLLMITH